MIVRKGNTPEMDNLFDAMLCWMDEAEGLKINQSYILRQTTGDVNIFVRNIHYKVDMNTLHREVTDTLILNEIDKIEIESAKPLYFDTYEMNRDTGSFVLINPHSNQTVAGGMIQGRTKEKKSGFRVKKGSENIHSFKGLVSRKDHEFQNGHKAHVFWLTGLSGSGKSSIAQNVEKLLFDAGKHVYLLDGDRVRDGVNEDLTFSKQDRNENIRRIAQIAKLFYESGSIVLCSFISPYSEMRDYARSLFPAGDFSEIFIDCSLESCKKRDIKGLYKKAEAGHILNFTGVNDPYEAPVNPDLIINTDIESEVDSIESLAKYIFSKF